ncbi:serine/threonine protein kinase [Ktedonospora formicarum]|uniref:non-specific serine/threonine protein kinase n=1 Tax=Ktedonospora formicarum TaxID=2778364 RepID=A0A8J3I9L2_9CHLR|nr:serine/threonine-protein kinase [Ktedonospora formicarum]GHO48517.1 hypothetical protein KSX_66800 [Ktedonospora formicarum]
MVDYIGQKLGNYTLKQLVGRGGFAEVYEGEHIYLKTPAAIKVLHAQLSGEDDIESFRREAQFIAHLVHPNIVRVLDFGIVEHVPFLVVDYASHGTLRQRHPRGTRLPLSTIVPYIKQVAALQYAHDERVIHRDVKPENMLLGRKDEVLLSDFGIALVAQSSRYQNTQDVIGTVAYMSPEQIQGKPRPASDQYSLGILIYEWLTGDRPFNGSFTELCTQHMFATVPPMREKLPTVPAEVEQVVTTVLAKEAKQRFGSVQAFANALEQASQGRSSSPSVEPSYPVTPSIQPAPALQSTVYQPNVPAPLEQVASPTPTHTPSTPYAQSTQQPQQATQSPPMTPAATSLPDSIRNQASGDANAQASQVQKPLSSAWGLSRTQLIAMVVGASLGGFLEISSYAAIHATAFFWIFYDYPFASYWTIIAFFALILFLATKYGPWVAIVASFVPVIVDIAQFHLLNGHFNLIVSECISTLLLGFIAGLAFVVTRGNYRSVKAIGLSTLGVTVFVFGSGLLAEPIFFYNSGAYFFSSVLYYIIALVVLGVLLLISNRFSPHSTLR